MRCRTRFMASLGHCNRQKKEEKDKGENHDPANRPYQNCLVHPRRFFARALHRGLPTCTPTLYLSKGSGVIRMRREAPNEKIKGCISKIRIIASWIHLGFLNRPRYRPGKKPAS